MTSHASRGSEVSSSVVAQYETLRGAALGGVLPPEARCGLMLFLHRGMWGWIRSIAKGCAGGLQQRSGYRSLGCTASAEHIAVVHVFAAMAMNVGNRGITT